MGMRLIWALPNPAIESRITKILRRQREREREQLRFHGIVNSLNCIAIAAWCYGWCRGDPLPRSEAAQTDQPCATWPWNVEGGISFLVKPSTFLGRHTKSRSRVRGSSDVLFATRGVRQATGETNATSREVELQGLAPVRRPSAVPLWTLVDKSAGRARESNVQSARYRRSVLIRCDPKSRARSTCSGHRC
jgi:hypothetical protein